MSSGSQESKIYHLYRKSCRNTQVTILALFFMLFPLSPCVAEIKTEVALTPEMIFLEAVQQGQLDTVRKFISNGQIEPNKTFQDGTSPLHIAVIQNHEPIVAVLIQAGANLNEKDGTTMATPLHIAALYGRTSIAKLLILKGADVNAIMKFGITPLMVAAQFNHPQIAEVLLNAKAKVNQPDEEGFTALHCAAQTGDEITAKLLLKNGARLDARDRLHATPLMVATQNNKTEMIQLLSASDPNSNKGTSPIIVNNP